MSATRISASADRQSVRVERGDGTHILTHRVRRGQRPSIHPIIAPDGLGVMTEDSPGHHPWQHGLYTGFNRVNNIGFWREEPQDGSFDPCLDAEPLVDAAGVARWSLTNLWSHPDGTRMITEGQRWSLNDAGSSYDIEIDWKLRAEIDIEIGEFMAGGLFLRMPYAPETGGLAVNSDGLRNGAAEKQRARWTAVSMPLAGRADWAGMAIMDHPSNPAHPTTWRVDNELGISPSRVIAGSWTIPAGSVDRYRFLVHVFCGPIDEPALDAVWKRFSGAKEATAPAGDPPGRVARGEG